MREAHHDENFARKQSSDMSQNHQRQIHSQEQYIYWRSSKIEGPHDRIPHCIQMLQQTSPSSLPSIISKTPNRTLCLFYCSGLVVGTLQAPNEVEEHSLKKVEPSWSLSLAYFPGADFPGVCVSLPINA